MLPAVVLVLGKGGVGRSTVAAALGAGLASRGARVLIVQWSVVDAVSPWFARPPAGYEAQPIAPGLATMNFSAEAALEQYFVQHLGMRAFYRSVISSRHVRHLTRAAPGLEELMFLGMLMWLTTLAREERGWSYDHVVVDPPAMGHATSLLAIPHATQTLGLGGILATECTRVAAMLADPARSAALVVTTPEELAVEETLEFWPRIARELGRPPLATIINRSVQRLGEIPADPGACGWLTAIARAATPDARDGLTRVYRHLARRADREHVLADRVAAAAPLGLVAIDDALLVEDAPTPRQIVACASAALSPLWSQP
ncbi:MAG TPA: ArsA-related P-loop ATPase [Kofleriaceae bacterium]|nr:ArsA-related P-loop ATPase [Kofleriaceae bacterium]